MASITQENSNQPTIIASNPTIYISSIQLKSFRCFAHYTLEFNEPIVLIEGDNGIGKTSLLEALYYACYLRSFRTHMPRELIQMKKDGFFLQVNVTNNIHVHEFTHEIQIGFSHNRKLVKVDQKSIGSYKELMHIYRVISITEDDIGLIKSSPHERRTFMDQALLLTQIDYITQLRQYKQLLDQRNALLQNNRFNRDSYEVLTDQVWHHASVIQKERKNSLKQFLVHINQLAQEFFDVDLKIDFTYQPKKELCDSVQEFTINNPMLYDQELRYGRTLFGAHLDDVLISFQGLNAKNFASRGQQKLIVLLIKAAQMRQLNEMGLGVIMLLDDYMTDFDIGKAERLLDVLAQTGNQLIFTSPLQKGALAECLLKRGAQRVKLTH